MQYGLQRQAHAGASGQQPGLGERTRVLGEPVGQRREPVGEGGAASVMGGAVGGLVDPGDAVAQARLGDPVELGVGQARGQGCSAACWRCRSEVAIAASCWARAMPTIP